jgi:putative membrane protein
MYRIPLMRLLHRPQRYSHIPCKLPPSHRGQGKEPDVRNRIKPGQLLVLAVYSYVLVQGCKRDWISPSRLSKLGAAIVGVLSMGTSLSLSQLIAVTGLLLSYRFSSALSRWDEGKKVWVALRSDIRDGIRMVCFSPLTS